MLTKLQHHEMPIQIKVPSPNTTEAPTVCTAYVVFQARVPEKVYGFYMVPPGQEWVSAAVKEWYGFDVKLGSWQQVENPTINRTIWEAPITDRVKL